MREKVKEVPRDSTRLVYKMKTNLVIGFFPPWNGDIGQFSHCSWWSCSVRLASTVGAKGLRADSQKMNTVLSYHDIMCGGHPCVHLDANSE